MSAIQNAKELNEAIACLKKQSRQENRDLKFEFYTLRQSVRPKNILKNKLRCFISSNIKKIKLLNFSLSFLYSYFNLNNDIVKYRKPFGKVIVKTVFRMIYSLLSRNMHKK